MLSPKDERHGTVGGYTNHGCRCAKCYAANSASLKKWKRKNPDYWSSRRNAMRLLREEFPEDWKRLLAKARKRHSYDKARDLANAQLQKKHPEAWRKMRKGESLTTKAEQ